jgi:uncharacterized membrane protein YphA (DoxX/SURF4 family)
MSEMVPGNFSVRTRTFLLVPARVFLGLLFILMAVDQARGGWLSSTGMQTDWGPWVQTMPIAPLKSFLTRWVLPFGPVAGIFVAVEFFIGALLILGFGVRLVSLLGMVLTGIETLVFGYSVRLVPMATQGETGTQLFRQGLELHTKELGLYGLIFLVLLVFLFTGAGRSIGLDGLLWRRAARRLAQAKGQAPEPPTIPASE